MQLPFTVCYFRQPCLRKWQAICRSYISTTWIYRKFVINLNIVFQSLSKSVTKQKKSYLCIHTSKRWVTIRNVRAITDTFSLSSDAPEEEKHFKIPTELIQHVKMPADLAQQVKISAALTQQGKLPTGKGGTCQKNMFHFIFHHSKQPLLCISQKLFTP